MSSQRASDPVEEQAAAISQELKAAGQIEQQSCRSLGWQRDLSQQLEGFISNSADFYVLAGHLGPSRPLNVEISAKSTALLQLVGNASEPWRQE